MQVSKNKKPDSNACISDLFFSAGGSLKLPNAYFPCSKKNNPKEFYSQSKIKAERRTRSISYSTGLVF